MSCPRSTVLITGAGSGLGPGLVRHFASQGAHVLSTTRAPDPAGRPDAAGLFPPSPLALDVASDESLFLFGQGLRRKGLSIDRIINLAGIRQIVALDRLDLADRGRHGPPLSFEVLAALRVAYALLDLLAVGVRVICVATPPEGAGEFGSLAHPPPRVSQKTLHAGLQTLAMDLAARRGMVAVLHPDPRSGLAPLPGPAERPPWTGDQTAERVSWVAGTVEELAAAVPAEPPRPLFLERARPAR